MNSTLEHEMQRQVLLHQTLTGEITPEFAEEQARVSGLLPLAEQPDPSNFEPLREANWSLAMAVAWIAWRTMEKVVLAWDEYRLKVVGWVPVSPVGYALARKCPASINALAEASTATITMNTHHWLVLDIPDFQDPPQMSVEEAWLALHRELRRGTIAATGVSAENKLEILTTHHWDRLRLIWSIPRNGHREEADALRYEHQFEGQAYRLATVAANDVMRLWGTEADLGSSVQLEAGLTAVITASAPPRRGRGRKADDPPRRLDIDDSVPLTRIRGGELLRDIAWELAGEKPAVKVIDRHYKRLARKVREGKLR